MLGKNVVTKPFHDLEGKLLVNDIWYTIQGEGLDAGLPAVFIRLAKCNLRCYFCDTEFETGVPLTARDIAVQIDALAPPSCKLVVITGGEPLLQNITPLVYLLNGNGVRVSVETAGTVWSAKFELEFSRTKQGIQNTIVCSPKTAGLNRYIVDYVRAWKYIVCVGGVSDFDGLPTHSTQNFEVPQKIYRPRGNAPVYLQPMDEGDDAKNLANAELAAQLCMKHGYRLSLQMHKLVGVK